MSIAFIVIIILALSMLCIALCVGALVVILEIMNTINEEWENINGNRN